VAARFCVVAWLTFAIAAAIRAGRRFGLFGQTADLGGGHGEARAVLARAGCRDGGVEGEEVGPVPAPFLRRSS
jgi:hypothetical protein